jgi:NTP pyrophosphatase (non-canonical NTP hydrolase)
MTFAEFQREALRTSAAPYPDRERPLVQGLGLCGEAGEVANVLKKLAWHGLDDAQGMAKLRDEMGDVLWYLADLASHFGLTLEEIAAGNVEKLRRRYPEGFVTGGGNRG